MSIFLSEAELLNCSDISGELSQNSYPIQYEYIQFSLFFCFLNFVCPPSCLVPSTSYAIKFFGPPKGLWSFCHGSRGSRFHEPETTGW